MENPQNKLTQKDTKFIYSKNCEETTNKIKKEICSPKILVQYDPNLLLTLATDACLQIFTDVEIGIALSHIFPDGTEHPFTFSSRTLTKTEQKYEQIDKEALAIVCAKQNFICI